MTATMRPLAAAVVAGFAGGAVGFCVALAVLRVAGPAFTILLCAPPFAACGWRLGGDLVPDRPRFGGATAARVLGLLTGALMGIFFGGWAHVVQGRSPYPVAAAPLALLFAVRGFWWVFEIARRREAWRV